MSLTITLTPGILIAIGYLLVSLMFLSAGLYEQARFVNPKYGEVFLIAILWPWLPIQIGYFKLTGRYLVEDVKRTVGSDS